jgi:hypothetical protein
MRNIEFIFSGRQTGKSSKLIKYLEQNEGSIMIVPNAYIRGTFQKNYPHLRDRIISNTDHLRGRNCDVVIDNIEFFTKEKIYEIFSIFNVPVVTMDKEVIEYATK